MDYVPQIFQITYEHERFSVHVRVLLANVYISSGIFSLTFGRLAPRSTRLVHRASLGSELYKFATSASIKSIAMRRCGFTPAYIAKWFINEYKTLKIEYEEINHLKSLHPDDPDVLAREAKFQARKQELSENMRQLPLPHLRMLAKHAKRHGIIDQARRNHGPAFDRQHADAMRWAGLNPDEPPAPAAT